MSAAPTWLPQWTKGDGPEADVVLSTRARLARSLADLPFPARATEEDSATVVSAVRRAAARLLERFPGLTALSVRALSREEQAFLLDAHLASPEQLGSGEGRTVIAEPGALLSIMVNEEDHLRIQALMSGLVPEQAWDLVDWADDVLGQNLEYGYSERYGFLTASLSNVGTGLRVSVLMHLAGMAATRRLGAHLRAAYDLGVSVRGTFGEGTRAVGDVYQVSNEVTLGLSEMDIAQRVRSVAEYLLDEERLARKELISEGRNRLLDRTKRALERMTSPRAIAPEQALTLLSVLRLASELGLVEECPRMLLNELLVGMRAGDGNDWDASVERAQLLRARLAGVHLPPRQPGIRQ